VIRLQPKPDVTVNACGVGFDGLLGFLRVMESNGLGSHRRQRSADGADPGRESAPFAYGDPLAYQGGRSRGGIETFPYLTDEVLTACARAQTFQLGEGAGSADAVAPNAHVALKLPESLHSAVAIDPVDATRIKTEGAQPALQLGDVVTVQHRPTSIEDAIAEPEAGLDNGRPSLASAYAVGPEAPLALEPADRLLGPRVESPHGLVVDGET